MSYIEDNLIEGEEILCQARIHPAVYASSIILSSFSFAFLCAALLTQGETQIIYGVLAAGSMLASSFAFVRVALRHIATEFAITNKRVIAKTGLVSHSIVEINLEKVEGIEVKQSLFGRIFGYGSIGVHGTGGGCSPLEWIAKPLEVRKQAQQAADQARSGSVITRAAA